MLIPPGYSLTPKISKLLASIEASQQIIDTTTIPPEIETNIRRQSTLKSSLFSARIEGNQLTLEDFKMSSKTQQKAEIFNVLKALNWLTKTPYKDVRFKDILTLHQLTMTGLTEDPGKLRHEVNAIFNTGGIAIYLPPPPTRLNSLLNRLLKYLNGPKEPFIPVKAALVHYTFEKIHPFLDGNGRTGRLILQKVLYRGGYGMKGLLSIEEYIDLHRPEYYHYLESSDRDVTDLVEFILEAIEATARQAKDLVLHQKTYDATDFLLPRRAEILAIIKDQRLVNFDQIRRRFLAVNERTLRYDLKKLQDAGLIKKLGMTKGVYYQPTLTGPARL